MREKSKIRIYMIFIFILLVFISICSYFTCYFIDMHKNDLGLVDLRATEKYGIDYKVLLSDGKYYDGNREFISTMLDKLNVYFNYDLVFDSEVNGSYYYTITGKYVVNSLDNNSNLYTKEFSNKDNTTYQMVGNVVNISDDFDVDLKSVYDDYLDIVREYGIGVAGTLDYEVEIHYEVYSDDIDKKISDTVKLSIDVPLSNTVKNITKSSDVDRTFFKLSDFGVTKHPIFVVIALEFIGAMVLFIIEIVLLVRRISLMKKSYYYRVEEALRICKGSLVKLRDLIDLKDYEVVNVNSAKDLVNIAGIRAVPVYYSEVILRRESVFMALYNDTAYVYKVSNEEEE